MIDYVNRFWIHDVSAEMQLFDLKTTYQFQTVPGVDQYNMPLYNPQTETPGGTTIGMYPMYQSFLSQAYIMGLPVAFETQKKNFYNLYPAVQQVMPIVAVGDGGPTYSFRIPLLSNPQLPLNPPYTCILRGHVDITGIMATGQNVDPPSVSTLNLNIPEANTFPAFWLTTIDADGNSVVVCDSGQILNTNANVGLLMTKGNQNQSYPQSYAITGITLGPITILDAVTSFTVGQVIEISGVVGTTQLNGNVYLVTAVTGTTVSINVDSTLFTAWASGGLIDNISNTTGNTPLPGGYSITSNTVNYLTGIVNVTFPVDIPLGAQINAQAYFFQTGLPRSLLYYNNTITLRNPPDRQYLVELEAYLTPAAFFNSPLAMPFGYMSEYVARGAARKILLDTGDQEQFQFYEPEFVRQQHLVWKRSQRQFTSTRTQTLYSQGMNGNQGGYNNYTGNGI